MANKVLFNNLGKQWELIEENVMRRMGELFKSSAFINGPDVNTFEENFADYIKIMQILTLINIFESKEN